ncbi:hypothetical protein J6590_043065 [Homalodisca vitripennis]|nr:hypothetical protein J6590_043065 [Homalodisca vitripennis]
MFRQVTLHPQTLGANGNSGRPPVVTDLQLFWMGKITGRRRLLSRSMRKDFGHKYKLSLCMRHSNQSRQWVVCLFCRLATPSPKRLLSILFAISDVLVLDIHKVLAALAFNCLNVNVGMIICMPVLIIGALRTTHSPLSFSEEEASWFGTFP